MTNLVFAVGLDVRLTNSIYVFLSCSASGYFLPWYVCHTKVNAEPQKEGKMKKKEQSPDSREGE